MPLKIPAPPEAKLTPATKDPFCLLDFDTSDRYGGEVGNPTFSAAHQKEVLLHICSNIYQ